MNLITSSDFNTNTWQQIKSRYVVAVAGLSVALGIAIGGAGALTFGNPAAEGQLARTRVQTPVFATAADAEFAARSLVQVIDQPSSSALDAERAAYVTLQEQVEVALAGHSTAATLVQPMFGTAADAEYAAQSLR